MSGLTGYQKFCSFTLTVLSRLFSFFPVSSQKISYLPVNLRYGGNVKSVYEKWITAYPSFTHIWYLKHKSVLKNNDETKIVSNGLRMLFHLMTSKYWIKEAEFENYLIIPRKETILIQLWHASGAFKKFGMDMFNGESALHNSRYREAQYWDMVLCSSENVACIYSKALGVPKRKIFVSGLPRNDTIIRNKNNIDRIKKSIGLNPLKKLILYAPTFRDINGEERIFEDFLHYIADKLPDEYIFIYRLHGRSIDKNRLRGLPDIYDFSSYNDVEILLCAADILVTDYSSIVFDYALLERPIIFYAPDYKEYEKYRGFYFEYEKFVPGPIYTEPDNLLNGLTEYDFNEWINKVRRFRDRFQQYIDDGNSDRVVKKIKSIRKEYESNNRHNSCLRYWRKI